MSPSPTPTLFDELADNPRRLGVTTRNRLCPEDERILDVWAEHGIPADLSTVEHACALLMALWAETQETRSLLSALSAPLEDQP
jgi:hypothetical protein